MGNTRHRNSLAFASEQYAGEREEKGTPRCPGPFMYSIGSWKARALQPESSPGNMELGLVGERRKSMELSSQLRILHPSHLECYSREF